MSDEDHAPFDPKAIANAAMRADLKRMLGAAALRSLDPEALADAQLANMRALIGAQKTAAARYQDAFETSLAGLMAALDESANDPDLLVEAYERAIVDFQTLASAASKANLDAFDAVRAEVEKGAAALTGDIDAPE